MLLKSEFLLLNCAASFEKCSLPPRSPAESIAYFKVPSDNITTTSFASPATQQTGEKIWVS
jgi:hypothetical protein